MVGVGVGLGLGYGKVRVWWGMVWKVRGTVGLGRGTVGPNCPTWTRNGLSTLLMSARCLPQ